MHSVHSLEASYPDNGSLAPEKSQAFLKASPRIRGSSAVMFKKSEVLQLKRLSISNISVNQPTQTVQQKHVIDLQLHCLNLPFKWSNKSHSKPAFWKAILTFQKTTTLLAGGARTNPFVPKYARQIARAKKT